MTPHAADIYTWIDWMREVHPSVYLDIGAGDGFDCAQVKLAFPDCRCIAIEPVEEWETEAVERHRDVIGDSNKYVVFYKKEQAGIHGIHSRIGQPNEAVLALPMRTLAHFCQREKIERVDAMKIDVEGAAWSVLYGAQDILDRVKAVHIETEWITLFEGQVLEQSVFQHLSEAGLTKVWENRVEELGQGDSIWIRK